jgi:hypothetical protein
MGISSPLYAFRKLAFISARNLAIALSASSLLFPAFNSANLLVSAAAPYGKLNAPCGLVRTLPLCAIIHVICVLPPPRSITRPCISEKLLAIPRAPTLPSSSLASNSTTNPVALLISWRNSVELMAVRVASVAMTRMRSLGTPKSLQIIWNRRRAAITDLITEDGIGTRAPVLSSNCALKREMSIRWTWTVGKMRVVGGERSEMEKRMPLLRVRIWH